MPAHNNILNVQDKHGKFMGRGDAVLVLDGIMGGGLGCQHF